ncbi:MAG: hypothetical protein K2I95_02110 [Treponemataceae bacterium]|nr:hypothetical protein [Treponemataceae bacterium]
MFYTFSARKFISIAARAAGGSSALKKFEFSALVAQVEIILLCARAHWHQVLYTCSVRKFISIVPVYFFEALYGSETVQKLFPKEVKLSVPLL